MCDLNESLIKEKFIELEYHLNYFKKGGDEIDPDILENLIILTNEIKILLVQRINFLQSSNLPVKAQDLEALDYLEIALQLFSQIQ